MRTEVREPSADHEVGRAPVMPVPLMSRDCSASRWDHEEGRLPTAFRSPSKLRLVSNVRADQEDGRLPAKPPLPTSSATSVLSRPMTEGNGSSSNPVPAADPDPKPTPLTVPMPGMPERSTPVMMPLVSHVTPAQDDVQGLVPDCQVERARGLPSAILTPRRTPAAS